MEQMLDVADSGNVQRLKEFLSAAPGQTNAFVSIFSGLVNRGVLNEIGTSL